MHPTAMSVMHVPIVQKAIFVKKKKLLDKHLYQKTDFIKKPQFNSVH